ncbi:LEM domain-containing protein [Loa loa]|uniref:LEM domain-containing protein n=1 Tax=Loa loa TaxID=7209 RepID=A0A1I7VAZ8_LOALO|nr:LEM domain-containing protein [Loa loa]EFO25542.1 LEM domain-containing protein [Loa loa]
MVNVDQLTNEEIRDQLMIHGCDPGPVIGSTRNVYANKLRRLLEESESNVMVPPERGASEAARTDSLNSSPKRRDVAPSPQKSRSPTRTTRSSVQDVIGLSKVQNISQDFKISQASPKTAAVSPAKSRTISDFKQSLPKPRVVQPSVPTPKACVDLGFETQAEVSAVPESHHSPSRASVTSECASLNVTSSSFKMPKSYPFGTIPEVCHSTPTTRFTSLRDNWENGKVSDGSDDDLRGEESSRILLPSWKQDHAYSVGYDSNQSSMTRRLDENSKTHYGRASRYSSGAMFENSCSGHGNRLSGLVDKEKASRSYGKICLILLFVITGAIFVFFVVQNYAELEHGEGNKEEF